MSNEKVRGATVVLFGGTGDLAARKLLPALFHLWEEGRFAESVVVGIGRRVETDDEYQTLLRERVELASSRPDEWARFSKLIAFHHGEIETMEDFRSLRERIESLEQERGLPGKRLFYYAVGPRFFGPITSRLGEAGLLERQTEPADDRWARIVVEKPYGHDGASARELDRQILSVIDERQLFRIDHYLGKETVQNMLAFRFGNGLFEPVWNQKYVESVQITVAESVGVENRGAYYEDAGALRDMLQNHMLQLLALTAMEPPISLEADAIRDEKVKALRAIRIPGSAAEVIGSTVRGQYGPGTVDGKQTPGYRDEKGVAPDSRTPTFIAARMHLDNWRWAHVPFFLRHGKRLVKRGTEIAIQFRTPPLALFRGTPVCGMTTNVLVLRIQPNEGIELHFAAKRPGVGMRVSNVKMEFEYEEEFHEAIPEAYQRLLLDAMLGDLSLFTRSDEVQAMWRFADAIQAGWDARPSSPIQTYRAGGWGPADAESLFPHGADIPSGSCPISWRRW